MPLHENLRTLHPPQGQSELADLEAAARAALQVRRGRPLTDADWAAARHDLWQYAHLLRTWALVACSQASAAGTLPQLQAA